MDKIAVEETKMFAEAAYAGDAAAGFIQSSEEVVEELANAISRKDPKFFVTCARGSSDHAALFGKYLIETELGLPVVSFAPSIASIYAKPIALSDAVFLAISQSGGSPDIIRSAETAKSQGALTIAVVNVEDSPLAEVCDFVLPIQAGPEESVAATKSYIMTLVAILRLVAGISKNRALTSDLIALPHLLKASWRWDVSECVNVMRDHDRLFVVGRGFGLGIAAEAALKFKETCAVHAEAFSAAEVKHGPMALVENGFPVMFFSAGSETKAEMKDLVGDFVSRGGDVLSFGSAFENVKSVGEPLCQDSRVQYVLLIQSFYRFVNELSVSKGKNPDAPRFLKKVTKTI
jgi:glucosamine--fructose-6-phosphate aminotransferase (isomerizing)